ncbi:outer membrane protein OmpK [Microbulbifer sp.]|uniref:outer membrane protein OmpK n=1 Tax=Microbulbifer sp. TaxID=1908541 RepID=UPI0025830433|nr:outer membrane protein OmpK [Microbulbifer sp.]
MKVFKKILMATAVAAAISPAAHAERFFGTSTLSLLHSGQYQTFGGVREDATVFTFENIAANNWGDSFFFIDRYQVEDEDTGVNDLYGEFAPRVSLSWLTGNDLQFGIVKDVLLAGTYEFGGGADADNYLAGVGVSWDLPGMQYFNTNVYYVDNNTAFDDPNDWQATITWGAPFEIGSAKFLFDGYADYSSGVGGAQAAETHINPQLTLDVGSLTDNPGVMFAGIEYSYWRNKFGSRAIDTENAVSALVKFYF